VPIAFSRATARRSNLTDARVGLAARAGRQNGHNGHYGFHPVREPVQAGSLAEEMEAEI